MHGPTPTRRCRSWGCRRCRRRPSTSSAPLIPTSAVARISLLRLRTDGSAPWLQVLTEATSALFHTDAKNKRKGVWIEIDSGGDDGQSERSSAVASEGSTVTGATSAVSTTTSGRCRWDPRVGCATGGKEARRAEVIMQWFLQTQAGPATENDIHADVGDNSGTSKAIRWWCPGSICLYGMLNLSRLLELGW
jgi:hypothetical protein